MNSDVEISIVTVTYSQQDFILDTIRGVLMQEYNGLMEYIIVNDNSPDDTDLVIKDFLSSIDIPLNIKIRYIKNTQNKGAIPNFIWSLKQATGKYVAICEGDDFWSDSKKLQKQVAFLEKNKDFSICFHAVKCKYENGIEPFINQVEPIEVTKLSDIARVNYITTLSVVYRNNHDFPDWFDNIYPGDWPLHIINATHGKIKFMKECMGVYRIHLGGIHSTTGGKQVELINTFKCLYKELLKRGFTKEADIINYNYDNFKICHYVFNQHVQEVSRFNKFKMLFFSKNVKFRLISFVPLFFNNSSYRVFNLLLYKKISN